jgi:hypothetical protein
MIESRIVHQVVSDALAQGYRIGVWCAGLPVLLPTDDIEPIMAMLMTGSDDHLHLYRTEEGHQRWAWIRLAYGAGWDVVHFHTSNIQALVAGSLQTVSLSAGRYQAPVGEKPPLH